MTLTNSSKKFVFLLFAFAAVLGVAAFFTEAGSSRITDIWCHDLPVAYSSGKHAYQGGSSSSANCRGYEFISVLAEYRPDPRAQAGTTDFLTTGDPEDLNLINVNALLMVFTGSVPEADQDGYVIIKENDAIPCGDVHGVCSAEFNSILARELYALKIDQTNITKIPGPDDYVTVRFKVRFVGTNERTGEQSVIADTPTKSVQVTSTCPGGDPCPDPLAPRQESST